jgi:hypothetical protein
MVAGSGSLPIDRPSQASGVVSVGCMALPQTARGVTWTVGTMARTA